MMKINQNAIQKINACMIAVILMTPIYIVFTRVSLGISSNQTTFAIMIIVLLLLFMNVILNYKYQINFLILILLSMIIILYIITISNYIDIDYSILQLGFYVILPILLGCQKQHIELNLKYLIILSLPFIFFIENMIQITNYGLNQSDMYMNYGLAVSIIATIVHFSFFRKKASFIIKLGYLFNLIYLLNLALTAVRGFWLLIICSVFFIMLYKFQQKAVSIKYYLILMVILISCLLCIIYADDILNVLIELTSSMNLDSAFFIKMKRLLESGDVSNGRFEIYKSILDLWSDKPIFGYGFNSSSIITNGRIDYPHNYVIQLLFDGGIVVAIIPILATFLGVYKLIKGNFYQMDETITAIFLISLCIPQALLSGNIWKSAILWLTISWMCRFVLIKILVKKTKI